MANRNKMSPAERAKQFMPFAALKGYEEALREKEKIVVDKIELSEEAKEELDRQFSQINVKDIITVIYYSENEYLQVTGMVSKIDTSAKVLRVVNTKIAFCDIYKMYKKCEF